MCLRPVGLMKRSHNHTRGKMLFVGAERSCFGVSNTRIFQLQPLEPRQQACKRGLGWDLIWVCSAFMNRGHPLLQALVILEELPHHPGIYSFIQRPMKANPLLTVLQTLNTAGSESQHLIHAVTV